MSLSVFNATVFALQLSNITSLFSPVIVTIL